MTVHPSQLTHPSTEARATPGLLSPKRWITLALDLVFPPRCAGCGRVDVAWCARCTREVEATPTRFDALDAPPPLQGLASTAVYAGRLRDAVRALKYEGVTSLAPVLAQRVIARLDPLNWTFDTVVPVPLHTVRLRQRGYNQAELIAEIVAAQLMIPCLSTALERRRDTRSQVGLSRSEREHNMRDAFRGDPFAVKGRAILLIDDVTTTGSTLQACAQAAEAAGASAIYGLTVASADSLRPLQ